MKNEVSVPLKVVIDPRWDISGWVKASKENNEILTGLNIINGKIVNKSVSEAFNLECKDLDDLI